MDPRGRRDLLGVVVLALSTAIGGGTIRDLLLDRHPIFWLTDPAYLVVITVSALGTMFVARYVRALEPLLLVADALGLALFSVAGAQIAERAGVSVAGGIVLGTITGAARGALRDVLSAQIPMILRRGNLYASAAIAGTALYFLLQAAGVSRTVATIAGMVVVATIRLVSIRWRLQLPVFELKDGEGR